MSGRSILSGRGPRGGGGKSGAELRLATFGGGGGGRAALGFAMMLGSPGSRSAKGGGMSLSAFASSGGKGGTAGLSMSFGGGRMNLAVSAFGRGGEGGKSALSMSMEHDGKAFGLSAFGAKGGQGGAFSFSLDGVGAGLDPRSRGKTGAGEGTGKRGVLFKKSFGAAPTIDADNKDPNVFSKEFTRGGTKFGFAANKRDGTFAMSMERTGKHGGPVAMSYEKSAMGRSFSMHIGPKKPPSGFKFKMDWSGNYSMQKHGGEKEKGKVDFGAMAKGGGAKPGISLQLGKIGIGLKLGGGANTPAPPASRPRSNAITAKAAPKPSAPQGK